MGIKSKAKRLRCSICGAARRIIKLDVMWCEECDGPAPEEVPA